MYVFDMDGVIADIRHREHLIPDWDAFFDPELMMQDRPNGSIIRIIGALIRDGASVRILTARPERTRPVTQFWLTKQFGELIQNIALDMRPDDDRVQSAATWKRHRLELLVDHGVQIDAVFDDREPNVLAMAEIAPTWRLEQTHV